MPLERYLVLLWLILSHLQLLLLNDKKWGHVLQTKQTLCMRKIVSRQCGHWRQWIDAISDLFIPGILPHGKAYTAIRWWIWWLKVLSLVAIVGKTNSSGNQNFGTHIFKCLGANFLILLPEMGLLLSFFGNHPHFIALFHIFWEKKNSQKGRKGVLRFSFFPPMPVAKALILFCFSDICI